MRILGLHIRDTRNAGDRYSSPLDYFSFDEHKVMIGDMRSPPSGDFDLVIYGGGSIIASPDFRRGSKTVAWGVGHHERRKPWHDKMVEAHDRASEMCDRYFPRDAIDGLACVPCASCMHPVFDKAITPVHEVVRYSAARRVTVTEPAGSPHMTNEDGTIDEAVRFIASGRKVVTSSYHGAYWARLLGREVELVRWGSKFDYIPDHLGLAECRARNWYAFREVQKLIGT